MPVSNYQPVDCSIHDRFEAAIVKREPITVELMIDDKWKTAQVIPLNVFARNGEEFFEFQFSKGAERRSVRLDKVKLVE